MNILAERLFILTTAILEKEKQGQISPATLIELEQMEITLDKERREDD